MKTLYIVLMLTAIACNPTSGDGSKNPTINSLTTHESKCLEDKLHWLQSPPESPREAIESIAKSDIHLCRASEDDLAEYAELISEIE